MQIISYNIQFGRGLDQRVDLSRICDSIRGADIICLQEIESGWKRSGEVDQPRAIAGVLNEYYYVFGSSFDMDNSLKSGDGTVINRRRRHGNMILSRWPIVSSRTFNLPKRHYADKFNMQMSLVESVVETDRKMIRVYNYHAGYLASEERIEQMRYLNIICQQSPRQKGAWSGKSDIDGDDWSNQEQIPEMPQSAIVCGDFNCVPDSPEYCYLVDNSDLKDSWQLVDTENLNTGTLRHGRTGDIRVSGKIDHIFVSLDLANNVQRVAIDHKAEGSDHKPIHCFIDL